MKILVDINHPAHVHFFRNFIKISIEMGNEVIITASDKDIAIPLIRRYNYPFIYMGSYGKGLLSKFFKVIIMAFRMVFICVKHKPSFMIGIGSSRITHSGFLLNIPTFVFTDTEHASEQILLYKPFAHRIITPNAFNLDFGNKHIRYSGSHELAYLHPNRFSPDKEVKKAMQDSKHFILRFVSWEASHDFGLSGLSIQTKRSIIEILKKQGVVWISSEKALPAEFNKYKLPFPIEQIHSVLYFAEMYIGEGTTMALEAAILGTPAVSTNPLQAGIIDELEKHELLFTQPDEQQLINLIQALSAKKNLKAVQRLKLKEFGMENMDVTQWMVDFLIKKK